MCVTPRCVRVCVVVVVAIDLDTRGLECRPLQWHGEDEPLGGSLFRCAHDVWQLRPLQSTRRHSRRRFLRRGTYHNTAKLLLPD